MRVKRHFQQPKDDKESGKPSHLVKHCRMPKMTKTGNAVVDDMQLELQYKDGEGEVQEDFTWVMEKPKLEFTVGEKSFTLSALEMDVTKRLSIVLKNACWLSVALVPIHSNKVHCGCATGYSPLRCLQTAEGIGGDVKDNRVMDDA
ncbi:hypothetical protein AMTR_s00019p00180290 [Amborella trichopoda]|uniref:Uncharacterized protein n=1 Tax=Amborella trichopoda TaxID=13333 RepID=W1PGY6_AMBTC|nr:hypothetical protein AMTR_s00019p00180290 [Amborella trichopoda]